MEFSAHDSGERLEDLKEAGVFLLVSLSVTVKFSTRSELDHIRKRYREDPLSVKENSINLPMPLSTMLICHEKMSFTSIRTVRIVTLAILEVIETVTPVIDLTKAAAGTIYGFSETVSLQVLL